MLQMSILRLSGNGLRLPTRIKSITVNPLFHGKNAYTNDQEQSGRVIHLLLVHLHIHACIWTLNDSRIWSIFKMNKLLNKFCIYVQQNLFILFQCCLWMWMNTQIDVDQVESQFMDSMHLQLHADSSNTNPPPWKNMNLSPTYLITMSTNLHLSRAMQPCVGIMLCKV